MAITRIGSITSVAIGNANTGSTSITVPSDAQLIVVGVSGFPIDASASFFSGGSLKLNGVALTAVATDTNSSAFEGALFYLNLPATGSQTLAWDWGGTGNVLDGPLVAYGFYKGIDANGPVRSSSGVQAGVDPHMSGTLTAQSGDLIVAWGSHFVSNTDRSFSWTGATEVQGFTNVGNADGSWAEASPTGNQTVSYTCSENSDGGVAAIVLKPAGSQ